MTNGVFQGPTRPGTDVEKFRKTGVSVPRSISDVVASSSGGGRGSFQGPVRPTTDEATFRKTGTSVSKPKSKPGDDAFDIRTREREAQRLIDQGLTEKEARRLASREQREREEFRRRQTTPTEFIRSGREDISGTFDLNLPESSPGSPISGASLSQEEFLITDTRIRGGTRTDLEPDFEGRVFGISTKELPPKTISGREELINASTDDIFLENVTGSRGTQALPSPVAPPEAFFDPSKRTVEAPIEEASFLQQERFKVSGGKGGVISQIFSGGAGVEKSIKTTIDFGKQVLVDPIETGAGVLASLPKLAGGLGGLGATIRTEPSFSLGFLASEVLLFKGIQKAPRLIQKGTDVFRTRGLKELQATDVIAPEFFKGQNFPLIRKGQTAGELLEEFKPFLPGETKGAGFTTSPGPFNVKIPIQRGGSELPGLFQAPKISPHFLRVSGEAEKKLFSLNVFDTFRPSAFRVTPEEFKLLPGITKRQKQIAPLKPAQQFFETAPKGKSFIPFTKAEKEAIIPFETMLKPTQKRFFFRFEGRRIPIFEFETFDPLKGVKPTKGVKIKTPRSELPSARDIQQSLSSSRIRGRSSITDPLDISSLSRLSSRVRSSLVSSPKSSRVRVSKRTRPIVSDFSFLPSRGRGRTFRGLSSSFGGVSRGRPFGGGGSSSGLPFGGGKIGGGFSPRGLLPKLEIPQSQQDLIGQRKFFRTPSFGGLQLGSIGFKLPKMSLGFERSGLSERVGFSPLPKSQSLLGDIFTTKRNRKGKIVRKKK